MKVRTLKVGTLEISLDDLDADLLEVGLLRLIKGNQVAEFTLKSPEIEYRHIFNLVNDSFCPNRFVLPGGPAAQAEGSAVFSVYPDGTGKLTTSVKGLRKINTEGGFYQGWLIHDLLTPEDLPQEDLDMLPHGADGNGNQRGAVFTVDGNPPALGGPDSPSPNTIWVPVGSGTFNTDDDGGQKAFWDFGVRTNWSYSLLEMLGIQIPSSDDPEEPRDPDNPGEKRLRLIPSGIARNILTDVFMKQATVFPELDLKEQFAKRLIAVFAGYVAKYDADGDGVISYDDVAGKPEAFIPPKEFWRMAITRELNEGWLRPRFAPSHRAFVLAGSRV